MVNTWRSGIAWPTANELNELGLAFGNHHTHDGDGFKSRHTICCRVWVRRSVQCWHGGVKTARYLTKQGVTRRQRDSLVAGNDEELTAVGVGASVGHGEDSGASVSVVEVLILKLHSVDGLSAGSVSPGEVSALGHEAGDDSVPDASLEVEGLA